MAVRYRYPGEDWTIVDGDRFTTDIPEGQCYVGYHVDFDVTVRQHRLDCDRDRNQDCTVPFYIAEFEDVVRNLRISTRSGYRVSKPPYEDERSIGTPKIRELDGTTRELAGWLIFGRIYLNARASAGGLAGWQATQSNLPRRRGWTQNFLPGTIRNITYTPLSPEPPDCVRNCDFKVFLEDELVFSSSREVCPEAEIMTDECPENTCQVDCGNHYCCYGSDGISVYSFLK